MRQASDKVAESLLKPQKNEVSSVVIQANKGYDVSISYCRQDKAHLCFLSDFPILKDETELDLIGFIFANKKIMLYFTSFGNFIQIFFHLSTSQWYVSYGKNSHSSDMV